MENKSYYIGCTVDKDDAKEIVDELRRVVVKKAIEILEEAVPEAHRKKNSNRKEFLINWLQWTNTKRWLLLYNVAGLKMLMNKKGISLSGRPSMKKMVDALCGEVDTGNGERQKQNDSVLTPKLAATKSILEKSFLPHRKGKHREHTSLGHWLEKPILKQWIKVANDEYDSPVAGMKFKGLYTAGLAAKKGEEYAKDSIDFVMLVCDPSATHPEKLKAWGFEAKGRVTPRTAAAEEQGIRYLLNRHIRIKDWEVHKEFGDQGERFQVLQHAYVYDFETVVLAVSDNQADLI